MAYDLLYAAPKKRRVFFSFHYQIDIWRVNQVRNSWRFQHQNEREAEGFFDASIWERSQRKGDESLKSLIREGIKNTSVTCILAGPQTYGRRWVRYEIARSVIKGNGLLTVYINRMNDNQNRTYSNAPNPLDSMGVYQANDGRILFAEFSNGKWIAYRDYTKSVSLPSTWRRPHDNNVISLSQYAHSYCYVGNDGKINFGQWVRVAAEAVGK